MSHNPCDKIIRWYFTITLVESVLVSAWLVYAIVSPLLMLSKFSLRRLALVAFSTLFIILLSWLVIKLWKRPDQTKGFSWRICDIFTKPGIYIFTIFLSFIVLVGSFYILCISRLTTDQFLKTYLDYFAPIAAWLLVLSIQTPIAVRLMRFGYDFQVLSSERKALIFGSIFFGLLLLISAWLIWTKIGLTPDALGWWGPGAPILPAQVTLALLFLAAALLVSFFFHRFRIFKNSSARRFPAFTVDVLICILLWALAAWRWGGEPARPSYFAPQPRPPNFEVYPYSDAAGYDRSAQRLLIGYGFETDIIRPLYSFTLATIQAINGIGYENTLKGQILLLALIPSLLYLLAKILHLRVTGVLVGLLVIFRESNSIALSGMVNVSHAKLIMSDLPATLGVILFTLLVLLWLEKPSKRQVISLLAGGVLGLTMLVRVQVGVLLLPAFVVVWIIFRRQLRAGLINSLVLLAGVMLVLSPWLWRNWRLTGSLELSGITNPSQAGKIGQRYELSPADQKGREPLSPDDEDVFFQSSSTALEYVQKHGQDFSRFFAEHFFHNGVDAILALPSSFTFAPNMLKFYGLLPYWTSKPVKLWEYCCSLDGYVQDLPYWMDWTGGIGHASTLPLLLSLFFIGLGMGVVFSRLGVIGLIPLFFFVTYSMSNAVIRISGWRFILPVDWVGLLYYGIGLIQLIYWIGMFFTNVYLLNKVAKTEQPIQKTTGRVSWKVWLLAGAGLLLLGALMPVAELLIPPRYEESNLPSLIYNLQQEGKLSDSKVDVQALNSFLQKEGATAMVGRALYPRFYPAGEGEPGHGWASFTPKDFNRFSFYLIGPNPQAVILPANSSPAKFQHAEDVLVIGCKKEDYLEAYYVITLNEPDQMILQSPTREGLPSDCN